MYTTDPDWYTNRDAVELADTATLRQVRDNAERTFAQCGGHQRAARMQLVMLLVDNELALRVDAERFVELYHRADWTVTDERRQLAERLQLAHDPLSHEAYMQARAIAQLQLT